MELDSFEKFVNMSKFDTYISEDHITKHCMIAAINCDEPCFQTFQEAIRFSW